MMGRWWAELELWVTPRDWAMGLQITLHPNVKKDKVFGSST